MTKKLFAALFTGVLSGAILAGSAVISAEEAGYENPFNYVDTDVEANLTIYRYYADADKDNMDFAMEEMKKKYPNLDFTIEHRVGSDGEMLRTWAAVGELPDIFEINTSDVFNLLKDNGDLYVMDDVVDETGFYDLFSNGAAAKEARTNEDGHQYGFGCEASNLGELWYNTELFEELGIKEPTNYEEFKEVITVLKDAGKVPIALFAAEKWPGSTLYSLAAIAEGADKGVDAINDGEASITEEPFLKAADKFIEIANLGAFGAGALSTNYQQAYEMMYSKEAGFFLSGTWFFLTLEADGMGEQVEWCKYNPFADEDVKEEVRLHALGGYQTEAKYSVNTNPPSGLDSRTVALLGEEFEYLTRVSAGLAGNMTTAIGDFEFTGSTGYREYYETYGDYVSFSNFTGDLTNAEFLNAIDNAAELVVSGNYTTADEFIEDVSSQGF